jgi:Caspase domain
MIKPFFIIFLIWLMPNCDYAQADHALIIGIDQYTPTGGYATSAPYWIKGIHNLEGCKNDALSIISLLTSRFNFPIQNVDSLYDEKATRYAILTGMDLLLSKCQPGDIAVIYYAGHGTRVKNSRSFEADHLDECIIPSDTWKDTVTVIRDKELSRIFNRFIDKNVKLTVIFDCCHSGSLSRGLDNLNRLNIRYAPEPAYDVRDPYRPPVFPENRLGNNFLILSAAQSDQPAQELKDDQHLSHGAFTLALTESFFQLSVDASASTIFSTSRAILKGMGLSQEPLMNGSKERQQQTFLGIGKGILPDRSLVSVEKISDGEVMLQGGFALGIYKENELVKLSKDQKDTLVKLLIDSVLGVSFSFGHVIKGNLADLSPGNQLIVTNWVSSGRPPLKLYIPSEGFHTTGLNNMILIAKALKKSSKIRWLEDLGKEDPYTYVFFRGEKCLIKVDTSAPVPLEDITVQNILSYCKKDSTLFMELPVSQDSALEFTRKISSNKCVEIVDSPVKASYILTGRLGSHGLPAYGWRRSQLTAKDSLESMPLVTDCYELAPGTEKCVGDSLLNSAMKLSKLIGWLNLRSPDDSKIKFAYNIEIISEKTHKAIKNSQYRIGDKVHLNIALDKGPSTLKTARYVYVFVLDRYGKMTLIYPTSNEMNEENRFPKFDLHLEMIPNREFSLGGSYSIVAPSGTDNYFLLATDEAIPNADQILNQSGVYSSVATRGSGVEYNLLDEILNIGNFESRGMPSKLPSSWSLERMAVRCTY